EADIFAAALNHWPVIELVAHRGHLRCRFDRHNKSSRDPFVTPNAASAPPPSQHERGAQISTGVESVRMRAGMLGCSRLKRRFSQHDRRIGMADNKKKRGGADRGLIALSEPYEVAYWSKKFKITPAKLKATVQKAGHSAKKVEAYIKLQKHKAADRARIAVSQPYEVSYWSKKFRVTPARLKAAV